jgi:hypothetical protein
LEKNESGDASVVGMILELSPEAPKALRVFAVVRITTGLRGSNTSKSDNCGLRLLNGGGESWKVIPNRVVLYPVIRSLGPAGKETAFGDGVRSGEARNHASSLNV